MGAQHLPSPHLRSTALGLISTWSTAPGLISGVQHWPSPPHGARHQASSQEYSTGPHLLTSTWSTALGLISGVQHWPSPPHGARLQASFQEYSTGPRGARLQASSQEYSTGPRLLMEHGSRPHLRSTALALASSWSTAPDLTSGHRPWPQPRRPPSSTAQPPGEIVDPHPVLIAT